MKQKSLWLIGIVVICLVVIGITYFMSNKPENNNINNIGPSKIPGDAIGIGSDEYGEFYDWETELNTAILDLFNEVYPENYDFDLELGKSYSVSLNTLEKKFKKDISAFNTDNIKCDIYESKVTVSYYEDEGYLRGAQVVCEKLK